MTKIEILRGPGKSLGHVEVPESATIKDVKTKVAEISKLSVARQSLRLEIKSKDISDRTKLDTLKLGNPAQLYVKDLGPQIGWSTVFIAEYVGPIVAYILVAACLPQRQETAMTRIIYAAWIFHYVKRVLETILVHRFSHGTMPIRNLYKNCFYYWGFAGYISFHANHPLWTAPPTIVFITGFLIWSVCELGNLSAHLLLRDLRPAGSTVRKIPYPNSNPLTKLFDYVSCPNYTYEVGAWLGFSIMSACLPAFFFAFAGFVQMSLWALGKHRNYKKEFPEYPKSRKAIVPLFL